MNCQCGANDWNYIPEINEAGWTCLSCGEKPGDDGWCPQLDREEIERKVSTFLLCLTGQLGGHELLYVSNGTMGECITNAAVAYCRDENAFDNHTVINGIMHAFGDSHRNYWAKQAREVL